MAAATWRIGRELHSWPWKPA